MGMMDAAVAIVIAEDQNNKFRKIIEDEIKHLLSEIELLKERAKPVAPDNAIGRLSRMEAINEKSVCEANLSSAKLRVEKLQQAIKRLENDDFGICAICEEPIPERRLELIPESTVCVRCLERRDRD